MAIEHLKALNLSFIVNALMQMPDQKIDMGKIEEITLEVFRYARVEFITIDELKEKFDVHAPSFDSTNDWFFDKINHKKVDFIYIYHAIKLSVKQC